MSRSATSTTATMTMVDPQSPELTKVTTERLDGSNQGEGPIAGFIKRWNSAPIKGQSPPVDPEKVRVLPLSEYKAAALSIAEAFIEDHCSRYIIDTPETEDWSKEKKWDLHLSIMEYIVYAHALRGLALTVGHNHGAVALWMPPGKNMDDLMTIFQSGMWRLYYKLSKEGRTRFFDEFLPVLHDGKAEVMGDRDNNSWYLVYIGTRPAARGKGYARRLIEHVTRQADSEGRACYLESSNDINPKIYGKMGFTVRKELWLKRAAEPIRLDLMIREPGAKPCDGYTPA